MNYNVYSKKCINRIIHNITLYQVISDIYKTPISTKGKGSYYLKQSPFSLDIIKKKKPFIMSNKKKRFKCFITGYSGSVIGFIQKLLKLNRHNAITFLLNKYDNDNKLIDIIVKKTKKVYINEDIPF